jgi:signal transduction histidine kinase
MRYKDKAKFYDVAIQLSFGCLVELKEDGVIVNFDNYIKQIPQNISCTFINENWADIFVPVGEQDREFNLSALLQESMEGACKILTVYDGTLYIEWKFSLIKGADSDQTAFDILGAGIDVTEHIELKQQLQHADRLATVGQLAAGIAHEINGPLNNILGYAQLSSKQQDLPEQVYQDLDNIVRLSLHAREVVKKVMLFSRQVPPKHDLVALNKVIHDSLYFTDPLSRQNKIKIKCRLGDDLPLIVGDFSQLRQVVVNLIVNSAQAMDHHGGHIVIQTHHEIPDRVILSVQDTGIGMTPGTLKQCFLPFFTTKDVDEGTGLGLSVVHGIIQGHNGEISVNSEVGKGSKFIVSFPIAPEFTSPSPIFTGGDKNAQ